ncbi:MAG: hypothetical protein J0H74_34795 [Chitinophagaceae bacterium]|nr:hypothetical protein [Chitinophagaceae bacterium]
MKKVLATILAIIYLSTSMGATIHLHYCMGKLVAWGLQDHNSKDCTFCGMSKKQADGNCMVGAKSCCHDEHKQIKSDKDQKPEQSSLELLKIAPVVADLPAVVWMDPFIDAPALQLPVANAPPFTGKNIPVFLRNCNFRI